MVLYPFVYFQMLNPCGFGFIFVKNKKRALLRWFLRWMYGAVWIKPRGFTFTLIPSLGYLPRCKSIPLPCVHTPTPTHPRVPDCPCFPSNFHDDFCHRKWNLIGGYILSTMSLTSSMQVCLPSLTLVASEIASGGHGINRPQDILNFNSIYIEHVFCMFYFCGTYFNFRNLCGHKTFLVQSLYIFWLNILDLTHKNCPI